MVISMYTYERLCDLCRYDNNESEIAHYLLKHLDSLESLTVSKFVKDTGISKASLHRFYNKGGYTSFKNLISILNDEVYQKQSLNMKFAVYKEKMQTGIQQMDFDIQQITYFISKIKRAEKVVFYGNSSEISCLKELIFYLFSHHIDVVYLDRWDMKSCYQILKDLSEKDVFIMVETSWRIQLIYENSIINAHILNLDTVNKLPFQKFYIGEANCQQYYTYHNIKISYSDISFISLNLLDQKIKSML